MNWNLENKQEFVAKYSQVDSVTLSIMLGFAMEEKGEYADATEFMEKYLEKAKEEMEKLKNE